MHIVEVVSFFPAETYLMRHLAALSETSLNLTIASKGHKYSKQANIQPIGQQQRFPVVYLPDARQPLYQQAYAVGRAIVAHGPRQDIKAQAVKYAFERLSPDLVHFQFGRLAVWMFDYIDALNIPFTVSVRDNIYTTITLSQPDESEKLQLILQKAKAIHTACDNIGEIIHRYYGQSITTTTIRTCLPVMQPTPINRPANGQKFLTIGRLEWAKGFDDLIQAMKYLPDSQLEIVGDGPEFQHLYYVIRMYGLEERVRLLGSLPFTEIMPRLMSATAYIQSSITEGFSNALAEAMMVGQAVFATPVGGTTEVIQDGVNGVVIPEGDPRGIAEKLALADDLDFLQRIGQAAHETAKETFDVSRHAAEFEAFFKAALS